MDMNKTNSPELITTQVTLYSQQSQIAQHNGEDVDVRKDFMNLIKNMCSTKRVKALKTITNQNINIKDQSTILDILIDKNLSDKDISDKEEVIQQMPLQNILKIKSQFSQSTSLKINQILSAQDIKFRELIRRDSNILADYSLFTKKISLILNIHSKSQHQYQEDQFKILSYMFNFDFKRAVTIIKINPLGFYNFMLELQLALSQYSQ